MNKKYYVLVFFVVVILAIFGLYGKLRDNANPESSDTHVAFELVDSSTADTGSGTGDVDISDTEDSVSDADNGSAGADVTGSEGQVSDADNGSAGAGVTGSEGQVSDAGNSSAGADVSDTGAEVSDVQEPAAPAVTYVFRNSRLLNEHYEKHGIEMGFVSAADYEAAASAVITNPNALFKTEKEDGDFIYYLEATNEFVVLSTDGYIRTYFYPSAGKAYFDRQ